MSFYQVAVYCPAFHVLGFGKGIPMQIKDAATFPANKMAVGGGVGVKMVGPIPYPKPGNFAHIGQKLQIPVYGSQADIWVFLADT